MKRKLILAVASLMLILLIVWTIWGNMTFGVTHYSVESSRLPASFDKCKIVAISDLHDAEYGDNNERLVYAVKREKPDIIAITGDMVDSGDSDLNIAGDLAKQLARIAPCFYVTGNHEAMMGDTYQDFEKMLLEAKVTVLHDQVVEFAKGDGSIQIAGLDDPDFTDTYGASQRSMLQYKLGEMKLGGSYSILLSHRPESFNAYVDKHIGLAISGHAHGGQFRLPFVGGLIAPDQGFFPKYDAGKFSAGDTTMIVSRGMGNSICPVRFNNRPELVVIELVKDKNN